MAGVRTYTILYDHLSPAPLGAKGSWNAVIYGIWGLFKLELMNAVLFTCIVDTSWHLAIFWLRRSSRKNCQTIDIFPRSKEHSWTFWLSTACMSDKTRQIAVLFERRAKKPKYLHLMLVAFTGAKMQWNTRFCYTQHHITVGRRKPGKSLRAAPAAEWRE